MRVRVPKYGNRGNKELLYPCDVPHKVKGGSVEILREWFWEEIGQVIRQWEEVDSEAFNKQNGYLIPLREKSDLLIIRSCYKRFDLGSI